jgi:hypothetical protein
MLKKARNRFGAGARRFTTAAMSDL